MPLRFHHSEFDPPPLWLGTKAKAASQGEDKASDTLLRLTKAQVEKLKKKVRNFDDKKLDPPYTSFEVITGHLWKCVCKARHGTVAMESNQQGCPRWLTVETVWSHPFLKPLSFAVKNVRQAVERMSDDYVRSALAYIAQQKDMNSLRYPSHSSVVGTGGPFRGNPNMYIVSWKNFALYDADFGWGKPVHIGPGPINTDGKAFIMDNGNGDGFNVAICLQASQLNALNKLFYEDIEEKLLHSSKL
ncbi:hypothetical protein L6164_004805 [Bauhinia variegata]|uniref:Uncharacterized protein n=1 Tax=Bauhinia variegata TaxID=167791 RepID=A0ACB9PRW4_BAUVA|nr:hypothetical protein L6164_004805 [Bauhinia variegata]